jgi:sugar lactone lactonase YvrE
MSMCKLGAVPPVLLLAGLAAGQTYTISTFAGAGLPPTPLAATAASVKPDSVALDRAGNLYFSSGQAVFRVDASGTLTRVAGSPGGGQLGDGGPAANARLYHPDGIAVDSAGNLYIADSANQRVRKVTPSGRITTVAGKGAMGYSGDGGPATDASLSWPYSVAVDSGGNLYITDGGNNRVRKVTPDGIISTVAGNGMRGYSGDGGPAGSSQLNLPGGITVDSAGDLFIADSENHRIRKVTRRGTISSATPELGRPSGVAVDFGGNLYIADNDANRVLKMTLAGTISTVAGNGGMGYSGDGGLATSAELHMPSGVAVDSVGNLYIADSLNYRIRKVDRNGIIATVAGNGQFEFSGDGGPATHARLNGPWSVALDSAGSLYISDYFNGRVRKVAPDGTITTVAGNGASVHTQFSGCGDGTATSTPVSPWGLAVDAAGSLYFADNRCGTIRKVTPGGAISTAASHKEGSGVAVDRRGNLFVSDQNRVIRIAPGGTISTVAGTGTAGYSGDGGPATSAQLNQPWGMALDTDGNLYIADSLNYRIRKVDRDGIITTVAGRGFRGGPPTDDVGPATDAQLSPPAGVAVDSAGNLLFTEVRGVVRKVGRDGAISTVAGRRTSAHGREPGRGTAPIKPPVGYSGDGGPATEAEFDNPSGISVARDGKIYIADYRNDCIRVLTPATR